VMMPTRSAMPARSRFSAAIAALCGSSSKVVTWPLRFCHV
jgi:hypothetical protein